MRTGADRLGGDAGRALPVAVVGVDDEDALAFGAELREVCPLVRLALAPDQLGLRIVAVRPSQLPASDREPERREVLALEEVVQMRRRELTQLGAHPPSLPFMLTATLR